MALPDNALSSQAFISDYLAPDGIERSVYTTDQELGGIALSDASQGLQVQVWTITYVNEDVIVIPADTGSPTTLFTLTGITEINLSFDQNMNVFVAYVMEGQAWYYWYDPIPQTFLHQIMASDVDNPRCCMDDKRIEVVDSSDILLAYTRGDNLYYREQRDRYTVEYLLKLGAEGNLEHIGMNKSLRVQFQMLVAYVPSTPPDPATKLERLINAIEQGFVDFADWGITTNFGVFFPSEPEGADFNAVFDISTLTERIYATQNTGTQLSIEDTADCTEGIILKVAPSGVVTATLHYTNSPLAGNIPMEDADYYYLFASDTGNMKIKKVTP